VSAGIPILKIITFTGPDFGTGFGRLNVWVAMFFRRRSALIFFLNIFFILIASTFYFILSIIFSFFHITNKEKASLAQIAGGENCGKK
jgi:hypothetical protein